MKNSAKNKIKDRININCDCHDGKVLKHALHWYGVLFEINYHFNRRFIMLSRDIFNRDNNNIEFIMWY